MAFEDTLGGPSAGGGEGESGRAGGEGTVGDRKPGDEKAGQDPVGSSTLNLKPPEEKGGPGPGTESARKRDTSTHEPEDTESGGVSPT